MDANNRCWFEARGIKPLFFTKDGKMLAKLIAKFTTEYHYFDIMNKLGFENLVTTTMLSYPKGNHKALQSASDILASYLVTTFRAADVLGNVKLFSGLIEIYKSGKLLYQDPRVTGGKLLGFPKGPADLLKRYKCIRTATLQRFLLIASGQLKQIIPRNTAEAQTILCTAAVIGSKYIKIFFKNETAPHKTYSYKKYIMQEGKRNFKIKHALVSTEWWNITKKFHVDSVLNEPRSHKQDELEISSRNKFKLFAKIMARKTETNPLLSSYTF